MFPNPNLVPLEKTPLATGGFRQDANLTTMEGVRSRKLIHSDEVGSIGDSIRDAIGVVRSQDQRIIELGEEITTYGIDARVTALNNPFSQVGFCSEEIQIAGNGNGTSIRTENASIESDQVGVGDT